MRWFFALCTFWLFVLPVQAANEQRVALVIGNAAYKSSPLQNPVNDARAMSAKLKNLGFEVIEKQNLTTKQIGATLREFRSRLRPGTEALFFYAGHGLQVKGVNYLPAVDADITAEEEVPMQSINVNQVLEIMEEAKTRLNLIFLDACRNNPFSRRFRSAADGLAKVNAPSGTLISFATRPGSVAADGAGKNGLYTEQLLLAMEQSNVPIEQVLKKAAAGVKKVSKGQQEPWSEGMIEGEFYFIFNGPTTINFQQPVQPAALDPAQVELSFWDSIKTSQDKVDFEEYLRQYPGGRFAGIAKNRIRQLAATAPAITPLPVNTPTKGAEEMQPGKVLKDCAGCTEFMERQGKAVIKIAIQNTQGHVLPYSFTGFIISSNGYILTSPLAMDLANNIIVRMSDQRELSAKVMGVDRRTYVALIKIDATGLPFVPIGNPRSLKRGEPIYAVGTAFDKNNKSEVSVTPGSVSATVPSRSSEYDGAFIETDIVANPDNLGGPLLNVKGEVIGISAQVSSGSGDDKGRLLVIPIDVAMNVQSQLLASGQVHRGRIGLVFQEVTKDLAETFGMTRPIGALVSAVEKGGPADLAGVKARDIVLKIDGKIVITSTDLPGMVGNFPPGRQVSLQVWRNGATKDLVVTLARMPEVNR